MEIILADQLDGASLLLPEAQASLCMQQLIYQDNLIPTENGRKLQFEPFKTFKHLTKRNSKRQRGTDKGAIAQVLPKGHRRKYNCLLGTKPVRPSCSLGVPPALLPGKTVPNQLKAQNSYSICEFTEHFLHFLAFEQRTHVPVFSVEDEIQMQSELAQEQNVPQVETLKQYDFLNTEIKQNPRNKNIVFPYGPIPGCNEFAFRPHRLPDAWIYLMKRGLSLLLPGSLPLFFCLHL